MMASTHCKVMGLAIAGCCEGCIAWIGIKKSMVAKFDTGNEKIYKQIK
jgi:hypothetical protein